MARQLVQTCAGLGVLCVVAALPSVARATPAWVGLSDISDGSYNAAESAAVGMDAKGDTMLVWVQNNGTKNLIAAARRPAGGEFGAPVWLSSPEVNSSSPVVATDPRGDATVAWIEGEAPDQGHIQATWCPAGGAFTPPKTLTGPGATNPVVAMDSKGDATVAWEWNNSFEEIDAASRLAGGEFEERASLSGYTFNNAVMPAVAMDPEGNTTVVWKDDEGGTPGDEYPNLIQMSTQPASAGFGPPTGFALDASYPAVSMDSYGDTTVVWARKENATNIIEASTRTSLNASFETPVVLSSSPSEEDEYMIRPEVAMDAAGDTIAAWASHGNMKMAIRPARGSFGKPIELLKSSTFIEGLPAVAMDSRGDSVVLWWQTTVDQGNKPLGSGMLAGGTFGVPAFPPTASLYSGAPSSPASLAIDSQGDAVSAWINGERVQVVGYQAGGPWLEELQAPTSGQAGAALMFSVSPLSVWSTVTSTTWSWGDGSPETSGTSATHVFSAPGTYQVSVSATDALDNVTNATRTITIEASPAIQPETQSQPTNRKPNTPVPKAVVSAFTPLFATRASTGGTTLGLLVGIPAVKRARAGDTIVLRCIAGCQRPLREIVHLGVHHDAHGAITISPPFVLLRATRIEIQLLAPGHVARFVLYHFVRTPRGLIAYAARKGCLSPAGRPQRCP